MPTDSWLEQVENTVAPTPSDIWRSHLMPDKKNKKAQELKYFTDKEVDLPPESSLMGSFDPMKNLHLWTMWRTAVNGRILEDGKKASTEDYAEWPFGKALHEVPLNRFIKVSEESQAAHKEALGLPGVGEDVQRLSAPQYIYFGVPRVTLRRNSLPSSQ